MKQVPYEYKNLPIPGGGYVTGFLYHKKQKGVLYARTDIGGTYRYDAGKQNWVSLIPHVTMKDLSETFPIALALNEKKPNMLYIACGINAEKSGVLAISEDYGESFRYEKIPVRIHGNLNGRGTDERLIVDQDMNDKLYYASQQEGLWVTEDEGRTWRKLTALPEEFLAFVTQVNSALIVSTAGVTTADRTQNMRGHSLYVSYDDGEHFEKLAQPESRTIEGCQINGLVAQRCAADNKYLYVTFASTGRRSYTADNGYSCDSGDTIDGRIVRYELLENGKIGNYKDITPVTASRTCGAGMECIAAQEPLDFGFSGISVSAQTSGMLICTTIVKDNGDSVLRSYDYGDTWQEILYDLKEGEITFRAPYMRPECNGGHSLIHWLSDIKINPFDDNEAWFNSGTGVFRTANLKDERKCRFTDWCDGIEETVHLNVYGMPKGEVQVIDILGDLGGFAFTDLDRPCSNSFADSEGNRYITCINADFSDENPCMLVVTPRGNWTGKTKGGLILSRDQGRTFERLDMPFGLGDEIDKALKNIENPNVNSGWTAMSPNCRHIVWSIAEGIHLPVSRLIVSHDTGVSFERCKVYQLDGKQKTDGDIKVFSDRTESDLFYAFGDHSDFYISKDGGSTYHEYRLPDEFPQVHFGLIDCADKTEVRGETGKQGVFYIASGESGLWKLEYHCDTDVIKMTRLTKEGDTVYRMGLGLLSPESDYYRDNKAIYFNGIIDGTYGFYRTLDEGKSCERINTDRQMYGEINSIDGDCRVFGRFYLATGSNGVKYGDQI
ncbi:MAG: endoglucanase [Lachnospiraceae bacterium]|nr:endoglucanase [Lachnospiraceae bacterium]MBO5144940.1 endoglucanase [Lachnospiraceae bacterium]